MAATKRTKQGKKCQSESLPDNGPLNLGTSNEYLRRTYEIYTYILSFISHDLLGALGGVHGYHGLLTLHLKRLTSERGSKDSVVATTDLQEFVDSAEKLVAAGIRMDTYIDKHVRAFRYRYGNPFLSRPSKILEIVLKDVRVTVSTEGLS
jgi:hypothetical protein